MTTQEFIKKFKWAAIYDHIRYGVPASITLAQGIIESNSGNSTLALKANNYFGIKAYSNPNGLPVYYAQDDDAQKSPFRMYSTPLDSFTDHSKFLLSNSRYLSALQSHNYVDFANQLQKDGYATGANYGGILVNTIDKNNLSKYDNIGNNKWLYLALLLLFILALIAGHKYLKNK